MINRAISGLDLGRRECCLETWIVVQQIGPGSLDGRGTYGHARCFDGLELNLRRRRLLALGRVEIDLALGTTANLLIDQPPDLAEIGAGEGQCAVGAGPEPGCMAADRRTAELDLDRISG